MNKLLNKTLYSTWFWAILPTLVISFFINGIGKQYVVSIESQSTSSSSHEAYYDLNDDGITELIHVKPGPPLINIPIMDNSGNYFDQWNLPGLIVPGISSVSYGNYDDDTFSEIYVFTYNQDSVFLNINEFLDSTGFHTEKIFISKVNFVENQINSNVKSFGFFDQDRDGKKEFYFRINTGFGLWPRHCYFYDLENRKLKSSPFTGINFNDPVLTDIDGDNRPEIFSNMTASGNYETITPYTDYSAWLMVLNDQLEFAFPPIEFPGFGGSLDIHSIGKSPDKQLVVVYNYKGATPSAHPPSIMTYTSKGKIVGSKTLAELGLDTNVRSHVLENENQINVVLIGSSLIIVLDLNLNVIRNLPIHSNDSDLSYLIDLDKNSSKEIFIYQRSLKTITIYNSALQMMGSVPFNEFEVDLQFSNMITETGENKLFIRSGMNSYFLLVKKNPYYLLDYFIYPAVYFSFFIFILVVKKVNTVQVRKKEAQKRKLQTLQLQSIKGQLDPHFTFNALNSVASLLYLDDRNAAYDYLNKFTRLLRQLLNDTEKVYRSLEEELEFVITYLNLEKLRFGDKFSYTIQIGDGVTKKERVPVMVLQIFVENAIKHGLVPLGKGGILNITIEKKDDYLKLIIEDNGIGRKRAIQLNPRQGKGLKMIGEFYEILNQTNPKPIRHTITDLYSSDKPTGTKAEVWVPTEF